MDGQRRDFNRMALGLATVAAAPRAFAQGDAAADYPSGPIPDDRAVRGGRGHRPIPGLFYAGEMVGGLLYFNYPSGTGLVSGALFGRVAGCGLRGLVRVRQP